jgi:hypothetical protein
LLAFHISTLFGVSYQAAKRDHQALSRSHHQELSRCVAIVALSIRVTYYAVRTGHNVKLPACRPCGSTTTVSGRAISPMPPTIDDPAIPQKIGRALTGMGWADNCQAQSDYAGSCLSMNGKGRAVVGAVTVEIWRRLTP